MEKTKMQPRTAALKPLVQGEKKNQKHCFSEGRWGARNEGVCGKSHVFLQPSASRALPVHPRIKLSHPRKL